MNDFLNPPACDIVRYKQNTQIKKEMAEPPSDKGIRNPVFDNIKGIGILLIVIGHNKYFGQFFPALLPILYNFHVWAFFFLLAIYPPSILIPATKMRDIVTRLMVPSFYFILLVPFLFYFLSLRKTVSFAEFIPVFLNGLIFQTAQTLSKSTGFQLYWFLPAFCVFSLLWTTLNNPCCSHKNVKIILLAMLHCVIGLIPQSIAPWIPLGLASALYIVPLALIVKAIASRGLLKNCRQFFISAVVFIVFTTISLLSGSSVNLGYLILYGINNFFLMVLHDVIAISGFFMLWSLARSLKTNISIQFLGRNSLYIYLVHQLCFQIFWQFFPSTHTKDSSEVSLLFFGIASFICSIGGGLLFAHLMHTYDSLRKKIFPRSYAQCITAYSLAKLQH